MRRTALALLASTTLMFTVVPAASAQADTSAVISSHTDELPEWATMGSSGAELLSSADSDVSQASAGSSLLTQDLLLGLGITAVLGVLANLIAGLLP